MTDQYGTNDIIMVEFDMVNDSDKVVRGNFSIVNSMEILIVVDRFDVKPGTHHYIAKFNANNLVKGSYYIGFALDTFGVAVYDIAAKVLSFEVVDLGTQYSKNDDSSNGLVPSFARIEEI